jgi:hypothetical protein
VVRLALALVAFVLALASAIGCTATRFSGRVDPGSDGPASDGADGTLDVTAPGMVVNACEPLLSTSGRTIAVGGVTVFTEGRRILLVQSQEAIGDGLRTLAEDIVDPLHAGAWETARISSIAAGSLTLEAPPQLAFGGGAGRSAQVCTLPEYSRVAVHGSASIVAVPWDGATGGVVAFLAEEAVVDGAVVADAAGFRGGDTADFAATCPTEDDLEPSDQSDSSGRGEGIDARAWGRVGRAAIANGGGGGNTCNAGGGGGAGGGRGGQGARFESLLQTGGVGGSAVASAEPRLLAGGGGGCGHCDELACPDLGRGGAGGGVVFLAAGSLSGSGLVSASGAPGAFSEDNGGGGGGGGGTILVWAEGEWDGAFRADGGDGGDTDATADYNHPPGAGGGGGRIVLMGGAGGDLSVSGGLAGQTGGSVTPEYEPATGGAAGTALRFFP